MQTLSKLFKPKKEGNIYANTFFEKINSEDAKDFDKLLKMSRIWASAFTSTNVPNLDTKAAAHFFTIIVNAFNELDHADLDKQKMTKPVTFIYDSETKEFDRYDLY